MEEKWKKLRNRKQNMKRHALPFIRPLSVCMDNTLFLEK